MPTYSRQRPVKALVNITEEQNKIYHIKYVYNNKIYPNLLKLSDEEKKTWFKIQKDNEDLIAKIYGDKRIEYFGINSFLPEAERTGVDDPLVNEYRNWLKNE